MLTPLERMLIEEARETLRKRDHIRCICSALEAAITPVKLKSKADMVQINDAYARIRDWVGKQIYPFSSLAVWQMEHNIYHSVSERRADRIQWLGYMLGEFDVE